MASFPIDMACLSLQQLNRCIDTMKQPFQQFDKRKNTQSGGRNTSPDCAQAPCPLASARF